MGKAKPILALLVFVLAAAFLWLDHRALHQTLSEIAAVQSDLAALRQEIERLQASVPKKDAPALTAPTAPDFTRDVAKFRAEIADLRARTKQLEQSKPAAAQETEPPMIYADSIRRGDYKFAGYDSPQAACQTQLWAIKQLDPKAYLASLAPGPMADMFAKEFADLPEGVMPGGFKNGAMYRATGFRILEVTPVSEQEVRLKVFLEGQNTTLRPVLKKVGVEWKWAGNHSEP